MSDRPRDPLFRLARWLLPLALVLAFGCQPSSKPSGGGLLASNDFTQVVIETNEGDVRFEVLEAAAPATVNALAVQILAGTYDDKRFFHRHGDDFLQFGEIDAETSVLPDPVPFELTGEPMDRGAVAMGWVGTRSRTSNRLIFPLTRLDPRLDDQFTVFGRVVSGMDVLDKIVQGEAIKRITARLTRPLVRIQTTRGSIVLELDPDRAPNTVQRVSDLVCQQFYDGTTFWRVEDTLIQGGDPNGDGSGGSGVTIPAEFNDGRFLRGSVGMARATGDINSADSQFFIMKKAVSNYDGDYTYFAKVIAGMSTVDTIQAGDVMNGVTLQFDLQGRDCQEQSDAPPPDDAGFGGQPPTQVDPNTDSTPPAGTT